MHSSTLDELHTALLTLHKSLLEYQKKQHEAQHGAIPNPHVYLDLVMNHESFQWLRELSAIIVAVDEPSIRTEPIAATAEEIVELQQRIKSLLTSNAEGGEFTTKYIAAVKADSDVATAGGATLQLLS